MLVAVVAVVAVAAASPAGALVHVGASVVPLLVSTCPAAPLASSAVVFAALW
jgi:hypothetical protein